MAESPTEVESLMEQLKTETRLVKIFVGIKPEPYLVQESTLINASKRFATALGEQQSADSTEAAVLRFPEDGDFLEAWQLLLFWIIKNRLPKRDTPPEDDEVALPAEDVIRWVKIWVLGHKFRMPRLQNVIMIRLLRYLRFKRIPKQADHINAMLRISPIDTPLRRLLAEEVVLLLESSELDPDDLNPSDGTAGLSSSLLTAYRYYRSENEVIPRAYDGQVDEEYLLASDYEGHWLTAQSEPVVKKAKCKRKRKREVYQSEDDECDLL